MLLTHHADAPNVANAGYRVVTKEVVPQLDGSKKANLEVEIAVDLMKLAPFYDTAVLVSGNGKLLKG